MRGTQLHNALRDSQWSTARGLIWSGVQMEAVPATPRALSRVRMDVMPEAPPRFRVVMMNININKEVEDFLNTSPCISRAKKFNVILNEVNKVEASNQVLAYIDQVERKMILLTALYIITSSTFSGFLGYAACGVFSGVSVLASVACKHANTLMEFSDNIKISINDKIFSHFKWRGEAEILPMHRPQIEIAR